MKIINIHNSITPDTLSAFLNKKLNPLFQQQRRADISFIIKNLNDIVEISQPDLYEGFLFKIEIRGTELLITRSEHYVDDVNSLTAESVLYMLFEELAGKEGVTMVLEG